MLLSDPQLIQILMGLLAGLLGWVLSKVNMIYQHTKDLRQWHEPDSSGKQSWKGDSDMATTQREMLKEIQMQGRRLDKLITEFSYFVRNGETPCASDR